MKSVFLGIAAAATMALAPGAQAGAPGEGAAAFSLFYSDLAVAPAAPASAASAPAKPDPSADIAPLVAGVVAIGSLAAVGIATVQHHRRARAGTAPSLIPSSTRRHL